MPKKNVEISETWEKYLKALYRASADEKKNRMRRHTIFRTYCRYYYRMTTVVTTVATENRMTTLATFFSHLRMSDVRHRF